MATLISFPNAEPTWVFDRDAVRFYAHVDRKVMQCLISGEALYFAFGAQSMEPEKCLSAFRANRQAIEQVARRKIEAGEFDSVSGVGLGADDFARPEGFVGHVVKPRLVVRESEDLRADPALLSGVRAATKMLEDLVRPNSHIQAYCTMTPGDPPSAEITLSDESSGASATSAPLTPEDLDDRTTTRRYVYQLWDDFLSSQFRSVRDRVAAGAES